MSDDNEGEHTGLHESQAANSQASRDNASGATARASSKTSSRSNHRSPSPSDESKVPLTPEESPPFRTTRKRSAGILEHLVDQTNDTIEPSPAHTRTSSDEAAVHVCICQPEPKPPRPRNAFILYRQHHQGSVVARNPGLANPDISKIIGEQWQNEPEEQKNSWKALAEEEKLRHQAQYPNYRYQPKRSARRGSQDAAAGGEKPKCQKCGGRTILTPSAPYLAGLSGSLPPTPGSAGPSVARTVPIFRDLSLESPANRNTSNRTLPPINMPPPGRDGAEARDELGPLSPEHKRRRYGEQVPLSQRAIPPRYPGVHQASQAAGPSTPYPPGHLPNPHPYPPAVLQARRESLPAIKGMASPQGPMPPPPRPIVGYQQHRLSQGHLVDRTLVLPPMQTERPPTASWSLSSGKTVDEQIDSIGFRYKIRILCQVAPPAPRLNDVPRGPLIAVEGESAPAVEDLARWLKETLAKEEELDVTFMPGPEIPHGFGDEDPMAQSHLLSAEWHAKHKTIVNALAIDSLRASTSKDTGMADSSALHPLRKVEENYNEGEDSDEGIVVSRRRSTITTSTSTDKMDIDKDKRSSSTSSTSKPLQPTSHQPPTTTTTKKPIIIIPNYSLHACNTLSHIIPIGATEAYGPCDHWQWTATLWRGILGPDLIVYVRDSVPGGSTTGPSVEMERVEGRPEVGLFVVKRVRDESTGAAAEVEASVLRRLGFEVSEWVRAFEGVGGK